MATIIICEERVAMGVFVVWDQQVIQQGLNKNHIYRGRHSKCLSADNHLPRVSAVAARPTTEEEDA